MLLIDDIYRERCMLGRYINGGELTMEHYLTYLDGFIQRICLDDNHVNESELTMERYRGVVFRQYATERVLKRYI